jgi:hypothetical protein
VRPLAMTGVATARRIAVQADITGVDAPRVEQVRHWIHLFNPHDDVFTAEIRLPAENFTQVETRFRLPDFGDHDASRYLGHRQAAKQG